MRFVLCFRHQVGGPCLSMHFSLACKLKHSGGMVCRVQFRLDVARLDLHASPTQCVCHSTQSPSPPWVTNRTSHRDHRLDCVHVICCQIYSRQFHVCCQLGHVSNGHKLGGLS